MNISANEIADIILKLSTAFKLEIDDFDMSLYDYGLDSLDLSGLYFELEKKFEITISDDDWEHLISVNEITNYINRRLGN